MRNDPGKSPDRGESESERNELRRQRMKSIENDPEVMIPAADWAEEMLANPQIRYEDNLYKAWRDTFYERFEEAFFASKLTVEEVARRAACSPITVQKYLQKEGMPRRHVIGKLAAVLGQPISNFLDESVG